MKNKEIKLQDVIKYLKENNNNEKNRYYLDYLLEESCVSKEWYEAILEKALKYKPKRVIDIGCCLGLFAYLFVNKGIEYIGIDIENEYNRFITDKIKFITNDYYNVREQFKNDIIISCLCVGYLIPIEDVKGKVLIKNSSVEHDKNFRCIAEEIKLN